MPVSNILADDLNQLMTNLDGLVVLDVRLSDDFAAEHIPDSINNAVFEMAFTERLADHAPNKSAPICVYGCNPNSMESTEAAHKLERLGYTRIYNLTDGIEGWKESHHATVVDENLSQPSTPLLKDGIYRVDLENSYLHWHGRNLLNSHHGSIAISDGSVEIQGGQLVDATLEIDFTKIHCDDLSGSEWHDVLIAHLESDDFFDTELFPQGAFQLTSADHIDELNSGAHNLKIEGDLTMRGQTQPVSIVAACGVTDDSTPALQARFEIDRTLWGMRYGSGKFFSRLAGHLVNDHIELSLKITCLPEA
jgi:polyisoprenoid-binding protein YceI/rhodanese-related sulfurtransferase